MGQIQPTALPEVGGMEPDSELAHLTVPRYSLLARPTTAAADPMDLA